MAALLLAVAVVFGTVRGLIAFDVWPSDPPAPAARPLVLPAPVSGRTPARALPRRTPATRGIVATPSRSRPLPAVRAVAAAAPAGLDRPAAISRTTERTEPLPLPDPRRETSRATPETVERVATGPLAPVATTVESTTSGLAGGVRSLTGDLGATTGALNPSLGDRVGRVGDTLADTVDGAGKALSSLLGTAPRR